MYVARTRADAVAADIGVMDRRSEECDHLAVAENRREHRDIEEMTGRQPRIVGDQDVDTLPARQEILARVAATDDDGRERLLSTLDTAAGGGNYWREFSENEND